MGITASATSVGGGTVTYSLSADSSGGGFKINPTTGVVSVADPSKIDYETSPGHAYTITVLANNGRGVSSQTFSIGVANVNEAPSGTNGIVVANEDTARVLTIADFGYSDVEGNALLSVKINTFSGTGTLTNNGNPVVAGSVISAADIAAGRLKYTPAANANGAAKASFTFQVRDNGGTANGGVDTDQTANAITFNVNAVNDAPTATGLTQSLAIAEDAAATKLFTVAPAVADIDSATVTARLTLNASAGTLIGAGTGVLNAGVLTYTITGTAAAVNAALAAVTYDSAQNFTGSANVGVTITDGANGPQGTNPTGTVSITVGAINDAPTATNLTQPLVIGEDAAPTKLFTTAPVVADVDSANVTATLTLANAAAGVLIGAGIGNPVAGGLVYTLSGTPAAVNAALAAVTFDSSPNFSGATNVAVAITDGANGPQGVNPAGTVSVTVNAVNDAPTITAPASQVTGEDLTVELSIFNFNGVSIADVDGAASQTVTLSVQHGILSLNGVAGLTFTVGDGVGDPTMTFSGSLADVNAALGRLFYRGDANYNGPDTITITTNDNGNTGSGGPKTATKTVTLDVQAINDAPTATNLTQALTIGEDDAATKLFALAPVVADIDSGTVTATLTLSAAAGVLVGAGAGVLNAGTLTYTITGTAAAVNTALAAVSFDSAPDFNGNASVGVAISDGANGPQGVNPTGTVSISVNAVNDAPTATNLTQLLIINEDATATTLFQSAPVVADVDSGTVTALLTVDAAAGTLNGAGAGVLNAGFLIYTISGTAAAVNAALAAVTFDSAPDFFGATGVGVTISDGANGPQGSNPTGGIGIVVNAVNDAPTLAATATNPAYGGAGVDLFSGVTASTFESGQLIREVVLTVSNVLDTDESLTIDGTSVALVDGTISSVPTATLGVSYSVAVSGGTATITITSPGLTAADTGTLVDGLAYTNTVVSPGDPSRVVTIVSLTDDAGTAAGGADTGTPGIASTVNFNIAPSIDVDGVVNYVENDGATLVDSTITIGDADDTDMEGATVVISSGYAGAEDVLTFTNTLNITGTLIGNTLTATGHATLAEYETFLESVRYQNTSNDPSTVDRILSYSVNDGFVNSVVDTATIHVAARNDEPTLTATANNPAFTENGAAVDLYSSPLASTVEAGQTLDQIIITVTNVAGTGATESLFIDGTTVELNNGNSETTTTNGMTASVALAGGTATVTISRATGISAAAMATLVDGLAYGNTSEDPGSASRVVTVTSLRDDGLNGGGDDNINDALAVSSTVAVTPLNDEPTLTATANGAGAVTFTETSLPAFAGTGPVDLFSSPSTSTVEAAQTLTQVVLSVTNVADTTEYLTIGATAVDLVNGHSEAVVVGGAAGTATVSVSAGTATITVTPTATFSAANVSALVDSLAYSNDDDSPTATTHTISVTSITDSGANGGGNDNTGSPSVSTVVTVVATNDGPVAVNDTFTGLNGAITNTTLVVDGPTAGTADPDGVQKVITGNILANDSDVDGGPLTVVAGTFTTAQGGTVTLQADGGFVYVPLPNTDGTVDTSDSFTYTVTDGNPGGQNGTATATVTIDFVPNSTIWYVDGSYDGSNGASDGSSLRPFTDFSQLNGAGGAGDVDSAGDTIFVYDGTYTDNLELEASQNLFGERHGLEAPDGGGGAGVTTLLAANAGAGLTQINGTITASTNNSIQAISWGDSAGVSLTGTNVGALHVNDENAASAGSINNATAGAVSISGSTAGMNLQFASVSSGAGTTAISLTNALGTFNAAGGTLSGHTSSEISISGGTGTISYGGIIGDGTGDSAQINNRTGGTVTLSGNITDSNDAGGGIGVSGNANTTINFTGAVKTLNTGIGDAVSMTNNTGTSNVNFTNGGLDIDTSAGTGFIATGAGTYSVTGTGNSITTNGNGAALNLDSIVVGAGGITFDSTSSTNSTGTAVAIDNVTGGAIALGTGSISGSDGDAFRVGDGAGTASTGGTSAITYSGSISKTDGTGQAVDIQDRAAGAGNITLSGNITHNLAANTGILLDDNAAGTITFAGTTKSINSTTATAVNLTDNAGATIAFTNGGLVINTTSGTGFNATGPGAAATTGGTVTVVGNGNTITTTTGTALNIVNTTIGANDVTFQSITSNGGSATGIILDTTGSAGGLHVTGTGSANSGGIIANKTGADGSTSTGIGIYLNNTSEAEFAWMQLNGLQNFGIRGNNVTGFEFDNSVISGTNGTAAGAFDEAAISFNNLLGSASISNSTISNGFEYVLKVLNSSGTLNRLTIDNTDFGTNNTALGGDAVQIVASNTATVNVTVTDSSFTNAREDLFNAVATQSANMDVVFRDNTLSNSHTNKVSAASNILVFSTSTGNVTYDISHNASNSGATGSAIAAAKGVPDSGSGGTMSGTINANTVGVSGVAGSGSEFTGIFASALGSGTHTTAITNNVIREYGEEGILLKANDPLTGGNSVLNATLTGNITTDPDNNFFPFAGLWVVAGSGSGVENNVVNLVLGNSSTAPVAGSPTGSLQNDFTNGDPSDFSDVMLQESGSNSVINLSRAGSAGGTATEIIEDDNVGTPTVLESGTINLVNTLPPTPPPVAPLMAAMGGVQASTPTPGDTDLSQAELDSAVAAAIAQWAHAGATSAQLAKLSAVVFTVADLGGNTIGDHTAGHIVIDTDAAGHGWFVDTTPWDNFEFAFAENAAGTDLSAAPSSAAAGHLDLLTAVMHEMGHELGLDHAADAHALMFDSLVNGERRLPTTADVAQADGTEIFSFTNIGTPAPAAPATSATLAAGHGGYSSLGEMSGSFANPSGPTLWALAQYYADLHI